MSVQKQKQEAESAGLPGAPPEVKQARAQISVQADAAIDHAVVDALFDKYAEKPPLKLMTEQARYEREAADRDRVIDFNALYAKVSRAAVRPGAHRAPSLAQAQAEYMAKLKGQGSVYDPQRKSLTQDRWAQVRAQYGETRRVA